MDPKQDQSINSLNSTSTSGKSFFVPRDTVNVQEAIEQAEPIEQRVGTIRTFQSDVAGSVKSDNISMIKIALAEKERREKEGAYFDLETKKKSYSRHILIIFAISVIISSVLGFVYWYFNKPVAPTLEQRIAPLEPTILYSEIQSMVSITNRNTETILSELKKETLAKLDLGTVKRILITDTVGTSTKNVTAQNFLKAIRSRAPESLMRVIDPYFFIGAYSFDPHDVFIIFKIDSYDTAYPAMLEWEKTIEVDLGSLFDDTLEITQTPESDLGEQEDNAVSVSTTDSTKTPIKTTNDSSGNIFKDRIIQNKDVRALVDQDGKVIFMYTFLDRKTLIIVSSEKGLKEVITRMTTGRIKR